MRVLLSAILISATLFSGCNNRPFQLPEGHDHHRDDAFSYDVKHPILKLFLKYPFIEAYNSFGSNGIKYLEFESLFIANMVDDEFKRINGHFTASYTDARELAIELLKHYHCKEEKKKLAKGLPIYKYSYKECKL